MGVAYLAGVTANMFTLASLGQIDLGGECFMPGGASVAMRAKERRAWGQAVARARGEAWQGQRAISETQPGLRSAMSIGPIRGLCLLEFIAPLTLR